MSNRLEAALDAARSGGGRTMTVLQLSSLFYLRRLSPCPYPTFVAGMKVARPTASHTLEQLTRLGFIERRRSPLDRRRTTIELLPAGETFLEMFTGRRASAQ